MSQIKTKKSASPWIQCEKCMTSFLAKDIALHSESCPPEIKPSLNYNFIRNETLYGTLDVKTVEDIKGLSSIQTDNLVFLSQDAMKLISVAIGDNVVIRCLDNKKGAPLVKNVWPTTEKSLTSILLTKSSLELSFKEVNILANVTSLHENCTLIASMVTLVLQNSKFVESIPELILRISKTHLGHVFTQGNKLSVFYFGKLLQFKIKSIDSEDNIGDNALEQTLQNMDLSEKFYKIIEKTKWEIETKNQNSIEAGDNQDPFETIGGLDGEIEEAKHLLKASLENKTLGFPCAKSILLYGKSGTGKTLLAQALAKHSKRKIISINATDLHSKNMNPEEFIKSCFTEAKAEKTVIILDELDVLCPSRTSRLTDSEKRVVSALLNALDSNSNTFIIGTTNKIDNIDLSFRRAGRFDREIEIPTPNPKGRMDILLKMLACTKTYDLAETHISEIALKTHGFVGADLVSLCSRAALHASMGCREKITYDDFEFALTRVSPSAMREVQIEVPNVKWSDIGGQEKLKLILKQAVEWPLKHADSFTRLGITPPKGVLMFGPPGCSKTMIAKALATESGLNFLSIKGPELFSKWVGESERAVREVFHKARQVAPSIIFFDEIDAIGGERTTGSSTSVQERVLAQLLTELDGITPLKDVTILAATNRPDRMDKALLRPGRLDRIVYVPLPDEQTREAIFTIKLAKMPVVGVEIEQLVERSKNYSGAEVNAVCHEAAMMALEESLDAQHVEFRHFEKALELITPRTPQSLIQIYEDYIKLKI